MEVNNGDAFKCSTTVA